MGHQRDSAQTHRGKNSYWISPAWLAAEQAPVQSLEITSLRVENIVDTGREYNRGCDARLRAAVALYESWILGEPSMLAEIVWNVATIAVVGGLAIPLVAIIGGVWHKIAKDNAENDLKRSMIERGMSVEEIERVLRAGKSGGKH